MSCSSLTLSGTVMRADSSGRFTRASTPSILPSLRSTRPTHDAQVMPWMSSSTMRWLTGNVMSLLMIPFLLSNLAAGRTRGPASGRR